MTEWYITSLVTLNLIQRISVITIFQSCWTCFSMNGWSSLILSSRHPEFISGSSQCGICNATLVRCFLNFFHARTVSPTGYRPIGSIFSLSGMNAVQKFAETSSAWLECIVITVIQWITSLTLVMTDNILIYLITYSLSHFLLDLYSHTKYY